FRRIGIFELLLNILNCDQALKVVLVIYHQQFLDTMLVQDFSASSSVVPTGTVIRFSLVITLLMGMSKRVSKRRSRLVRMPTSFLFIVIGTPEILSLRATSSASQS